MTENIITVIYKILLKDNEKGEIKEIIDERDGYHPVFKRHYAPTLEDKDEGVDYMWTEGNYACDCNRYNFFYPNAIDDVSCGDERFELLEISREGRVLYKKDQEK